VLIADEPSSALDVTSQKMVIKMLRQLIENWFNQFDDLHSRMSFRSFTT